MAESIITKTFRFRIFPSKAQTTKLENTLDLCRDLYNSALQERREAYKLNKISLNYHNQANQLKEIKQTNLEYREIYSQVLQDVLKRVDKAFQNFFRRVKSKQSKVGFPRFKGKFRYNSFTFTQSGFTLTNSKLTLSKIGKIKIKLHRQIIGKAKTLTISRDLCGKWFACFSVETMQETLKPTNKAIGIDCGLKTFATLSDGNKIDNPRFFKRDEKRLAVSQRRFSEQPKVSKERNKKRKIVAKIHAKIRNRRNNFAHQESRKLVNSFDLIFFESLNVSGMMKSHHLNKAIADVSWNQMIGFTTYKAEYAGKICKTVNPRHTSTDCHNCGHRQKLTLDRRIFDCPSCHISIDRDFNASLNILAVGLNSLGNQSLEALFKRSLVRE